MLAHTVTHALVGLDPRRVEVEAHIQSGLSAFSLVGLADRACQEAKARVRSSVAAAELEWPNTRITINLAPAALRKEGSGFDLPIALAVRRTRYRRGRSRGTPLSVSLVSTAGSDPFRARSSRRKGRYEPG